MADGFSVKVEGLEQLRDNMRKLADKVQNKIAHQAVGAAARIVKDAAKANVRQNSVDTGSLFESIITKKLTKNQTRLTSEYIVTPRQRRTGKQKGKKKKQAVAPHARFIEFGTIFVTPRPFLGPALKHNVSKSIQVMKDRLEAGLKKAAAELPKTRPS